MAKEKKNEAVLIRTVLNLRKSIRIAWTKGVDKYDVNFHDNALPSFLKAIESLDRHICTLCELPTSDANKIVPTGIMCRENGDNILARIVAKKATKKGIRVFNIVTPALSIWPDDANKTVDHMDEKEAAAVERVIEEAERYIAGERAQGQIEFVEETAGGGKPADDEKTEKFPGMEEPKS